jgi:hypothetical protein
MSTKVSRTPPERDYPELVNFFCDPRAYAKGHGSRRIRRAYRILRIMALYAHPHTTAAVRVELTIWPVIQEARLMDSQVPSENDEKRKRLKLSQVARRVLNHIDDAWLSRWHAGDVPVGLKFDRQRMQMHIQWEEYVPSTVKALQRRVWREVRRLQRHFARDHLTMECRIIVPHRQPRLHAPKLRPNLTKETVEYLAEEEGLHLLIGLSERELEMMQPLVNAMVLSLRRGRRWVSCKSCQAPLPKFGTTKHCFRCRQLAEPWALSRRSRQGPPRRRGRPPRLIRLVRIYGRRRNVKPPKLMTLEQIMKDPFDDLYQLNRNPPITLL